MQSCLTALFALGLAFHSIGIRASEINSTKLLDRGLSAIRTDLIKAKEKSDSLLLLSEHSKASDFLAAHLYLKSKIDIEEGHFEDAMRQLLNAIQIAEQSDDYLFKVRCMVALASIQLLQNDLQGVEKITTELIPRASRLITDQSLQGEIYYISAQLNLDKNDTSRAIHQLKLAEKLFSESENWYGLTNIYKVYGNLYFNLEQFHKALSYFYSAVKIADKIENRKSLIRVLNNIGLCYYELQQNDSALFFLRESARLSNEMGVISTLANTYMNISLVFEELDNSDSALHYLKKYTELNDTLYNSEKTSILKSITERYESERKQAQIDNLKVQRNLTYAIIGVVLGSLIVLIIQIRKIINQKRIVDSQKADLQHKNNEIFSSINYAKRIQKAILPPDRMVNELLGDSFIIYLPKDIVAGDFYWMDSPSQAENEVFFAACDCTGHGVPGALVSVVCYNALNRSINEFGRRFPGEIFDKTRELVLENFEKSDEVVQDGMDASLAMLKRDSMDLFWAGANNPLWLVRNTNDQPQLIEYKPDKQPIGKGYENTPFKTHQIKLEKDDCIYLFTDGYTDQFGGDKGKKLTKARFRELLLSINALSMNEQKQELFNFYNLYRGGEEQVDDVCIIGLRV
jgi:serine phosphatase RsbU (regulator of sigma subunit)